jgi:hypothetical protein
MITGEKEVPILADKRIGALTVGNLIYRILLAARDQAVTPTAGIYAAVTTTPGSFSISTRRG